MAIIDYRCKGCGKEFFEIVLNSSEKVCCPGCGSEDLERVYKGKYYGKGGACSSGSCSSCPGCH